MAEKWNPKIKQPDSRGWYETKWYEERDGLKVGRPRISYWDPLGGWQASPGTPETGVVRLESWRGPRRDERPT